MSDPREGLWHIHRECEECEKNMDRIIKLQYLLDGGEARVKELEEALREIKRRAERGSIVRMLAVRALGGEEKCQR